MSRANQGEFNLLSRRSTGLCHGPEESAALVLSDGAAYGSPMSSTRDYMRHDYPRRSTTALVWLVSGLVAAFVLQLVLLSPKLDPTGTALRFLTLTIPGLKDGHLWSLLTHAFLHDTSGPQI